MYYTCSKIYFQLIQVMFWERFWDVNQIWLTHIDVCDKVWRPWRSNFQDSRQLLPSGGPSNFSHSSSILRPGDSVRGVLIQILCHSYLFSLYFLPLSFIRLALALQSGSYLSVVWQTSVKISSVYLKNYDRQTILGYWSRFLNSLLRPFKGQQLRFAVCLSFLAVYR